MAAEGWDYIIVGAGSAGCLIANRLTADPACRVLLLEAGGDDKGFWLQLPVGYYRTMYDQRFSRTFRTEPEDGTGGRALNWPRGRVLGGSSSINGLLFIRGEMTCFDRWAEQGCEGWGAADVLPHFRRLERYEPPAGRPPSQRRGAHGELAVSDLRHLSTQGAAWLEAAKQAGHPENQDFNDETSMGVGAFQLSIGGRWRMSAARAFLRPAMTRPNLTVRTGALAHRVLFEGQRATGVEWSEGRAIRSATAGTEVIVCAGAIQSPQLLQLSGIGPAETLRAAGIEVRLDRAEVGGGLQDHYQMRLVVRTRDRGSLNLQTRNPLWLARAGLDWLTRASGPLTIGAGQVGGAARTVRAPDGSPDVQFMGMPFSTDRPDLPLHRFPGFTSLVWQCHPESRGRVDVASADPVAPPRIVPNYLATELDRATVVEGVKLLREIHAAPAFAALGPVEVVPGPETRTDAEILEAVRRTASTIYHPCGTVRMGGDADAPLDPRLRVRGVEGLRVADASVMPVIPSANINAPTLMVAEKAAEMIRADAA